MASGVFEKLKEIKVEVVERKGLHQKFAFIDREVAWEGSLNILSQSDGRTTEHMRRIGNHEQPATKTCEELIDLHKLGSDSEVDPGSRRPIQTDRCCPNPECRGARMVIKHGRNGFFGSCPNFPKCRESFSIRREDRIGTDVVCEKCGEAMVATLGRFGVYLRCLVGDCTATRRITV